MHVMKCKSSYRMSSFVLKRLRFGQTVQTFSPFCDFCWFTLWMWMPTIVHSESQKCSAYSFLSSPSSSFDLTFIWILWNKIESKAVDLKGAYRQYVFHKSFEYWILEENRKKHDHCTVFSSCSFLLVKCRLSVNYVHLSVYFCIIARSLQTIFGILYSNWFEIRKKRRKVCKMNW